MASLDRGEVLILFASFLIGSAAGWWSSIYWGNSLITLASTLIGIIVGYYAIVTALRALGQVE